MIFKNEIETLHYLKKFKFKRLYQNSGPFLNYSLAWLHLVVVTVIRKITIIKANIY